MGGYAGPCSKRPDARQAVLIQSGTRGNVNSKALAVISQYVPDYLKFLGESLGDEYADSPEKGMVGSQEMGAKFGMQPTGYQFPAGDKPGNANGGGKRTKTVSRRTKSSHDATHRGRCDLRHRRSVQKWNTAVSLTRQGRTWVFRAGALR